MVPILSQPAIQSAAWDLNETTLADLNQPAHKYLGANRVFLYLIDATARVPKEK